MVFSAQESFTALTKDTSGLLMIAKNDEAHLALAQELKDKKVSTQILGDCSWQSAK